MKAAFLFFSFLVLCPGAYPGGVHRGPKVLPHRILPADRIPSVPAVDGHPRSFARGPGDSIGYTLYDYASSGGAYHNIIVHDDGAVSVGRTAETDSNVSSYGTYYAYSPDGETWTVPWSKVEATGRQGWGNIDELKDFGGTELVVSPLSGLYIDAARGAGVWSEDLLPCILLTPRIATGDSLDVHILYHGGAGGRNEILYCRYPDVMDHPIFMNALADPDALDIAVHGDNIYAAVFPEFDGTPGRGGGDVVLATSTDRGENWVEQVVYDSPDLGELPVGQKMAVPDGSGCIIIDPSGLPHLFWSSFLAVGDENNDPQLFYSVTTPIYHWSDLTGANAVAWPDPDTTIGIPPGRGGNYATSPDAGVNDYGVLYVIFQRMVNEVDPKGNYYEHVFGTWSWDDGVSWHDALDLTPGSGFDAAFSSMADRVDDEMHFVYNCDDTAGNSVSGNHMPNRTAVMYNRAMFYIEETKDEGTGMGGFALQQNFPNPCNPETRIGYAVGSRQQVTVTIVDLLGREVATLVNDVKGPGTYEVSWDGTGYPSGVYFYRLRAGGYSETKKLILLK